jgi:hypothetical protein
MRDIIGRRWKKALTGGSHLSAGKEKKKKKKREKWGCGPSRLGCAAAALLGPGVGPVWCPSLVLFLFSLFPFSVF